jgi:hypothetical protein
MWTKFFPPPQPSESLIAAYAVSRMTVELHL